MRQGPLLGGLEAAAGGLHGLDRLALHVEVAEQAVEPLADDDVVGAALDQGDGVRELGAVGEVPGPGDGADLPVGVDVLVEDVAGVEAVAALGAVLDDRADLDLGGVLARVAVALADADDRDRADLGGPGHAAGLTS